MDSTTFDLVAQGGALAALLALIPLLQRIDRHLTTIAGAVTGAIDGARDAGVQLDHAPTVRSATAATLKHLKGAAAVLLMVALLFLAGCSCNDSVGEGLRDLRDDFDLYHRASVAAVASDADAHARLGAAIHEHIVEAIERTKR